MAPRSYDDRLDPATYEDDDEVIDVFEADAAETDALGLSGSLFRRLTTIASAYELHTLPLLVGVAEIRLSRPQLQTLLDEVAFVAERVDDAPLVDLAQRLSDYVVVRVRRAGWTGNVIFDLGG